MILSDVIEIRVIIEEYADCNLQFQTAYKFMKFLQDTEKDYNFFINKTEEIIEKYALRDENNQIVYSNSGSIKILEKDTNQAQEELEKLALVEVSIGDYFHFNIDEFIDIKMSCKKLRPLLSCIIN